MEDGTMILVTGATGNVGSQVVRQLREGGADVRAFVRDHGKGRQLLEGIDIATGDFVDPGSVARALEGVQCVFLASSDSPQKVAHEAAVIDAAADAHVHLIVKCSTIGAEVGSPLPPFNWHGQIEEHLRQSGVPAVVLQSCFYMTNLLAAADQIRRVGKLFAPAGEGRIAMIDPRDTAAVAAVALTTDGHEGQTYVLTGPEAITYARVADELSQATGGRVDFVHVPDDATQQGGVAAGGLPDWLVKHFAELFPLIRQGGLERTTETVRAVTGRKPRTFGQFARDHAHAFESSLVAQHS
jgi:uncharacterized protein YbjT (DUF2867 family)